GAVPRAARRQPPLLRRPRRLEPRARSGARRAPWARARAGDHAPERGPVPPHAAMGARSPGPRARARTRRGHAPSADRGGPGALRSLRAAAARAANLTPRGETFGGDRQPARLRRVSYARELFDYLLHRKERLANDRSAHRELLLDPATPHLPVGLEIEWLGTSGFRLAYEGTTLLVDPYLTRPGVLRVASQRPLVPDLSLVERFVPAADAVLVGHTHFDHALDVPLVAERFGCKAYG